SGWLPGRDPVLEESDPLFCPGTVARHPAVTQAGQDRLAQPGDIVRPEVELGDRRAHRTPLLSAVEHWQTELMENRERQLHLRFDANGADDQALAALAGEVLQAVLPIPASPRTTNARLSPRRTALRSSSSLAHSLARPRSTGPN